MSEPASPQFIEHPSQPQQAEIDPIKLETFMQQVKADQNLPLGFLGGAAAAVVAAIIWAIITAATDFQIGWMAVGVGFLVGLAVRQFGKGIDRIYGIMGAAFSLLGCLAGNVLTVAIVLAREESISILNMLLFFATSPGIVIEALKITFSPIDLLFYGIAIYAGYRYAFRRITQAELVGLVRTRPQPPSF